MAVTGEKPRNRLEVEVAEMYDEEARHMCNSIDGLMSKSQAKKAWNNIIEVILSYRDNEKEYSDEWVRYDTMLSKAKEIRTDLF